MYEGESIISGGCIHYKINTVVSSLYHNEKNYQRKANNRKKTILLRFKLVNPPSCHGKHDSQILERC